MDYKDSFLYSEDTGKIIQCFYQVYNGLGVGFSKKHYLHALTNDLRTEGLSCEPNIAVELFYKGIDIGDFHVDILVNRQILVYIETDNEISSLRCTYLYNKLKSSIYEVGLLLNFGASPEHARKQITNDKKYNPS